jgi:hypothetical protein
MVYWSPSGGVVHEMVVRVGSANYWRATPHVVANGWERALARVGSWTSVAPYSPARPLVSTVARLPYALGSCSCWRL